MKKRIERVKDVGKRGEKRKRGEKERRKGGRRRRIDCGVRGG